MLKRILIVSILALTQTVCNASPLQSRRFFANNKGMVDHLNPLLLSDQNASDIVNITLDDRGQLSKRNGYTVIQSTSVFLGYSTYTVNGGSFHKASSGSDFFAVVVGTEIFRIGSSFSSYTPISGTVSPTATPSNLAQATHLQDYTIFCNEVDKPFYVGSTGNATTISTNTFSAGKTCATYGSYLVVANTTESSVAYPSRVRWSDINNINSFPPLNYIDVEPDNGDSIVAVIANDESVYIFKHRSIYRMLITGLDGPDAFQIHPVSRNIGAWAKQSVKVIPNVGIVFLAQNTAYLLSDSGLKPIGDPIQRTFDGLTRTMWPNAVGEVYPKKYQYWLAVSTTSDSKNHEVLVYDYVQDAWTIYDSMDINMLAQAEDSNGNNILISGNYAATTFKQDNGSTDAPSGTARAIAATYTTNEIMLDSPDIAKGFKYLYLYTVGDVNYTLTTKAAYDFSSTYETSTNISIGSASSLYDTGTYDSAVYPASGKTITRIELNRTAKSLRLQFVNSNSGEVFGLLGWTIVYQMQDFTQ